MFLTKTMERDSIILGFRSDSFKHRKEGYRMPVIIVYGIPEGTNEDSLKILSEKFIDITENMEELGLKNGGVSVFFPADRMKWGLGEEIIIMVEGLFEKLERTIEVKKRLARELVEATVKRFPAASLVECFVKSFDPNSGFFSSEI